MVLGAGSLHVGQHISFSGVSAPLHAPGTTPLLLPPSPLAACPPRCSWRCWNCSWRRTARCCAISLCRPSWWRPSASRVPAPRACGERACNFSETAAEHSSHAYRLSCTHHSVQLLLPPLFCSGLWRKGKQRLFGGKAADAALEAAAPMKTRADGQALLLLLGVCHSQYAHLLRMEAAKKVGKRESDELHRSGSNLRTAPIQPKARLCPHLTALWVPLSSTPQVSPHKKLLERLRRSCEVAVLMDRTLSAPRLAALLSFAAAEAQRLCQELGPLQRSARPLPHSDAQHRTAQVGSWLDCSIKLIVPRTVACMCQSGSSSCCNPTHNSPRLP